MKRLFLFISVFILFSCEIQEKNSFRGNMRCAVTFNKDIFLESKMDTEIDTIGPLQIDFFLPYIITTVYRSPYFAKIYNDQLKEDLGYYFSKGLGPKEFLSFGILNQRQENPLWVQDYVNKRLYNIDLLETIKEKDASIKKRISYKEIEDPLQLFYFSDSLFLIKSFENQKGLMYRWYNPIQKNFVKNEILLYKEVLVQKDLNNIMTLADCLKPDGSKIASLTGSLNQIDILDLKDNRLNLSFTTGKQVITLQDVQEGRINDYYLSLPRCNDHLIFALFQNKQNNNSKEIHVISWSGEPLYRLCIKEDLRDFNINWNTKILYGIDSNDIIYKYDISALDTDESEDHS
ncbi:hypothetical protein [Parabacteroides pacaensis]|uniref:hypothetical protein n=1 Tax=Parabacteroides pacaensis TaxID=2086575 RepID=UPI000D0F6862|nr:hypothetical protein [Parabacteroides pacaensis]